MTEEQFKNLKIGDIIYDSCFFNDQGSILKFNNYAKSDFLINNFHIKTGNCYPSYPEEVK